MVRLSGCFFSVENCLFSGVQFLPDVDILKGKVRE